MRQILEHRLIVPFQSRILWVYGEWQEYYEALRALFPHIEFVHGWREQLYDTIRADETNLLVLDDQMCDASDSKQLARLFTQGSHHRNLTVIYLVQNVYDKGKSSRTVSLNAHYQVVFRNRRDASQFRVLASQMAPHRSGWLMDAFEDATREPFGYLLIDNHPRTPDDHRFRIAHIAWRTDQLLLGAPGRPGSGPAGDSMLRSTRTGDPESGGDRAPYRADA